MLLGILAIMMTYGVPAVVTHSFEIVEATAVAQAKDKEKEKAKDKDIEKEKGKDKKGKDKAEKTDQASPDSGVIPGGEVALLVLGGCALLIGGGLLARKIFR
jgi:hypothetical protein